MKKLINLGVGMLVLSPIMVVASCSSSSSSSSKTVNLEPNRIL